MTCTGKTFNLGFAFLSKEDAPTYTWVLRQVETWCPRRPDVILTDRELGLLKAITIVYPDVHHMLCMVHVQRNIENYSYSKSKKPSVQASFTQSSMWLLKSKTREEFETRHSDMTERWRDKWGLMEYLNDVWLVHAEKLVWFLTDQYFHIDNRSTNRYIIFFFVLIFYR